MKPCTSQGPLKPDPKIETRRAARRALIRAAGASIALATTAQATLADGMLSPAGPIAAEQTHHFWQVIAISMIVVLPVLVGVPLIAWRYRYGNTQAKYAPHWELSHGLEFVMWAVPAVIVAVLGVLLWQGTHNLDPYRAIASEKAPLKVDVVGLDWKWLFIYPQYHIATVGEMAFPKDRPVQMKLTSDTVLQSFQIPELAGQIYAMPGMTTQLHLAASKTGHFTGDNTQFSGDGFHDQHFTAVAMSKADFGDWLKKVQNDGTALNTMAYDKLATSSTSHEVHAVFGTRAMPPGITYFNDVPTDLFQKIVNRYHNGKPMTAQDQPGSAAYNARYAG